MASDLRCQSRLVAACERDDSSSEGAEPRHTYIEILKSSALIGGSQVATIAVQVVRAKTMAVMLGPAGFGLMGLYGSIIDLVFAVASLGIAGSGVRLIAESMASGDGGRIARSVAVLGRTTLALGIIGLLLTIACAQPLAALTFGNEEHTGAVALLSIAVLFRIVAAGQRALIQGMRRIVDLAKLGVIGAVLGVVPAIVLVFLLGEQGVAPSLIAVAAGGLAASWWYARKAAIPPPTMTRGEARQERAALLKLGAAFMASGVLMMGAAYAVRTIVLRMEGLDAAGFYGAAWTLGGLYVGIILQAMGTDFYPRLVGTADDHRQCNQLVNEQMQVSLLLAGPGVVATLVLAPLILSMFYSPEFAGAVGVLRWICLGVAMRVITWPMGFIILARNRQFIFLVTEVAWTVVNLGLTWACIRAFGLDGAGIAFFGSYLFYGLMIYPIVRSLSGFAWSAATLKIGLVFISPIVISMIGFHVCAPGGALALGIGALVASSVASLCILVRLVPPDQIPAPIRRLLVLLRLLRSGTANGRMAP